MEMSEDTWFAVRETPGVGDFLGLKDPIPLQEHEVAKMLHSAAEATEEKPKVKVSFNVGDTVRVREGPFENFEGKVMEINEKKGMVKVTMEVFGRATNVDIEYWNLEKID
jgi:transcriptional antiterminator NusG